MYRSTSLMRIHPPLGSCSRPIPRALWKSRGVAFSYERGTAVGVEGVWCRVRGHGAYRGTSLIRNSASPLGQP